MVDITFVIPIAILSGALGAYSYRFFNEKRKETARREAYKEYLRSADHNRIVRLEDRVFRLEKVNVGRDEAIGWVDPRGMTTEQLFKDGDA